MNRLEPTDSLLGTVVGGRYRVMRQIGRGGMGSIYEVEHVRVRRRFALKCLRPELSDQPEWLARLRREADAIAQLRHPSIVEVFDWDALDDGSPCMVMELLEGENLHTRVERDGALPWPMIAKVGDQLLAALQVAHRAGVVHRDLKPENVFLASDGHDERVKLLDFGISRVLGAPTLITGDSHVLGTPSFMAPEQADGRSDEVGPITDVWASGAILYQMATGRVAFRGDSIPQILYRICHGRPDNLAEHRVDAPARFCAVIAGALERSTGRRIPSAAAMRQALREALAGVAPEVAYDSTQDEVTQLRRPLTEPPDEGTGLTTTLTSSTWSRGTALVSPRAPRRVRVLATLAVAAAIALAAVVSGDDADRPQPRVTRRPAAPAARLAATAHDAPDVPPIELPVIELPTAPAAEPPEPQVEPLVESVEPVEPPGRIRPAGADGAAQPVRRSRAVARKRRARASRRVGDGVVDPPGLQAPP